jgi:hypothetical protein
LSDKDDESDGGENKDETNERDDHNVRRMVLDPFSPGEQSCGHEGQKKFASGPQSLKQSSTRGILGVPQKIINDPAHVFDPQNLRRWNSSQRYESANGRRAGRLALGYSYSYFYFG